MSAPTAPAPGGLLPVIPDDRADAVAKAIFGALPAYVFIQTLSTGHCLVAAEAAIRACEATRPVVDAGGDAQAELTLLQIEDVIRRAYQPGHLFPLGVIGWVQELIDQRDAALAAIATPPAQPAGVSVPAAEVEKLLARCGAWVNWTVLQLQGRGDRRRADMGDKLVEELSTFYREHRLGDAAAIAASKGTT